MCQQRRGFLQLGSGAGSLCPWNLQPSLTTLGFCQWGRFPDLVLYQMASVSA